MMSKKVADNVFYTITTGLCFLALLLLPFQQDFAMKSLRIAGEVALLAILISPRKYLKSDTIYIAISLLVLSVLYFAWFRIYKTPDSEYVGAYMNYRDWSLVGIFSAFTIPVISTAREQFKKLTNYAHLAISLLVIAVYIVYSCYQYFILHDTRAILSLTYGPGAPAAAYTITFISLYSLITVSTLVNKYRLPLLILIGFASFIAISATATRAGMITYPILFAFIFWKEVQGYSSKQKKMCIYAFLALAVVSASVLHKPIVKRVNDLTADIIKYNANNSETSVGARFAMYKTGFESSYNNVIGQPLEERNEKIKSIIANNKDLSGARHYLNVHLHNQLIDTLSTTGWLGVTLNILFLLAVIIYIHKQHFPLMYTYVVAMMMFSLSDTLTYSTPIPLAWLLTLALMCSLMNNKSQN